MKYSILMTVYDREPEIILATLRSLSRCDLTDCELIVVNDGSNMSMEWTKGIMDRRFDGIPRRWIDAPPYEAFRINGGFNNPARAFNLALDSAEGENVVIVASDTLVGPRIFQRIRRFNLSEVAWTPMVVDIESSQQYCGPMRLFPAPWCLAASRQHCLDIGGWDETYLQGMCYEDNDFMGRLVLRTGAFVGDWTAIAYHQSHHQPAYNIDDPGIKAANDRNRDYTKAKWKGIPFHPEFVPFDVNRKPHRSGDIVHECTAEDGLLESCISKTTGIIAEKNALLRH